MIYFCPSFENVNFLDKHINSFNFYLFIFLSYERKYLVFKDIMFVNLEYLYLWNCSEPLSASCNTRERQTGKADWLTIIVSDCT